MNAIQITVSMGGENKLNLKPFASFPPAALCMIQCLFEEIFLQQQKGSGRKSMKEKTFLHQGPKITYLHQLVL